MHESNELLKRLISPDGPGAAVLIARGDQVLLRTARGRAQIELGEPLSADHVFRIASITKIFAAATVLKLVEAGKISLDDSLSKYLPDFPHASAITIRQLLNHTAGISDVAKKPDPGFGLSDHDTAAIIARIGQSPLDFTPGTRWAYSNSGFVLLGAVIEKVTGEPWYETLRKLLLEPLGLKHTGYGDHSALIPGRASGYTTDNPGHMVTNVRSFGATEPRGAGDLVSTVDDLRRWIRALAGGRVIDRALFQQMITPAPSLPGTPTGWRYGLGMILSHVRGAATIGHTGQTGGFASCVTYIPAAGITVVVLANDDNFDARGAGRRLAAIALGEPYRDPVAIPLTEEQARALAGRYRLDSTTIETLSVRDGKLYAQRGNHNVLPLQMTADNELHLVPDELSYWVPVHDAAGRVTRLDYYEGGDGPPRPLPRIEPAP